MKQILHVHRVNSLICTPKKIVRLINTTYFLCIKKLNLSLRSLKSSNLSADNFKKHANWMGWQLILRYDNVIRVSGYCFDSCQLTTTCMCNLRLLTWDQALFSFRFVNNIPAGIAKQKESLIQTFYETSAAHYFDWLKFAESANQNYFRCLFL